MAKLNFHFPNLLYTYKFFLNANKKNSQWSQKVILRCYYICFLILYCLLVQIKWKLKNGPRLPTLPYSEWSNTSRNIIFSWRPDLCVCVCVCLNQYNSQNLVEICFNRDDFHANWCPNENFMGFWIFWKMSVVALTFVDLSYRPKIAHKYKTSIKDLWYWIWPKSIEAFKFFEILVFWEFSLNCVTCANFELLSWKFVYECTNTNWCFIRNLVKIGRGL